MRNVQHYGLTSRGRGTIHGDCEKCNSHIKLRAKDVDINRDFVSCDDCGYEQPIK